MAVAAKPRLGELTAQALANSVWAFAKSDQRDEALFAAIAIGLGIRLLVYRRQRLAEIVVYLCGLMQTIPSLALLALMIPIFGIGFLPAIIALFLYSLLHIVRNAITALANTDPTLVRVSAALGLSGWEQLRSPPVVLMRRPSGRSLM